MSVSSKVCGGSRVPYCTLQVLEAFTTPKSAASAPKPEGDVCNGMAPSEYDLIPSIVDSFKGPFPNDTIR